MKTTILIDYASIPTSVNILSYNEDGLLASVCVLDCLTDFDDESEPLGFIEVGKDDR